ncbi:MAG: SurA N-terminal domain-containing protein [Bdellovibrionales bacterium]|nr:SurA N-terminal domain-containing protein [Bdellovibrionales bacterium]
MNRTLGILISTFAVWLAVVPAQGATTLLNSVVASVDGEPITLTEVQRFANARGEPVSDAALSNPALLRDRVMEMLMVRLLEREADAQGIRVATEEVDSYIDEIKRQNNVDDGGLDALLRERGITLTGYREQVRVDILRARLLNSRVRNKINVVDEDIDRYLEDHPELRPEKGKVHVLQVTLPADTPEQRSAAHASLVAIRDRVRSGESLRELATAGFVDLGYVAPEDLREDFREALARVESEGLSEIVSNDLGEHLLQVVGTANEDGQVDESLKNSIREIIFEARYRDAVEAFLNTDLPKKYNVEVKL